MAEWTKQVGVLAGVFALATVASYGQAPTGGSASSEVTLHLDPATTTIRYTAGSALKRETGTFTLKGGLLAFDPETGIAQGQILVDAASGHSKDKKFDTRMQNEVLESGKYPEIFFHAEKSSGRLHEGKEEHVTLAGEFNIHGADHPLKVDAVVTLHGDTATFRTEFDVPYVEWGMKSAGGMLFHDRIVHITVEGHATVDKAEHGS